jgi:hypothetical protein
LGISGPPASREEFNRLPGSSGLAISVNIGVDVPFTNKVNVIAEEMNGTDAQPIGAAAEVRESGNPAFLTFKTSGTWYEVYFDVK